MNTKASWGFTDKPDWARIAREVQTAGGALARVKVGEKVFTLVNYAAKVWPPKAVQASISKRDLVLSDPTTINCCWLRIDGDYVNAFQAAESVKVEVF